MYVVAYETASNTEIFLEHALSMDNVCNRRLLSIPSKVEVAKEQEYWDFFLFAVERGRTLNTFMELLHKCSALLLSEFHQLNSF